jgi:hypothetical protein
VVELPWYAASTTTTAGAPRVCARARRSARSFASLPLHVKKQTESGGGNVAASAAA